MDRSDWRLESFVLDLSRRAREGGRPARGSYLPDVFRGMIFSSLSFAAWGRAGGSTCLLACVHVLFYRWTITRRLPLFAADWPRFSYSCGSLFISSEWSVLRAGSHCELPARRTH